jgi:glycosyltransferase involved in cell wall biosynthesis
MTAIGDCLNGEGSLLRPNDDSRENAPGAGVKLPFGVNLAGYFQSEKGVGEGARAVVRALQASGIPYVLNNVVESGSANQDHTLNGFSNANPYAINLVLVEAGQAEHFHHAVGPRYFQGRVTIAYWNWELEVFPPQWRDAFEIFDEIWTPSTFTQRAIAASSPIPVLCVPYAVSVPAEGDAAAARRVLDLPNDPFVFLFAFDFQSFMERKNPLATVRAFQRAFGDADNVCLVLKTVHGREVPEAFAQLQAACAGQKNVCVFDAVLDRGEMIALVRASDAVVSLHRAEGFGLLLAEAMALGKPAVATAYSANTDFMTDANSLLVRYRRLGSETDHGPYRHGLIWADPDIGHAAELMRRLVREESLTRRLGDQAREDMAREYNPARIGRIINERLHDAAMRGPRTGKRYAALAGSERLDRVKYWTAETLTPTPPKRSLWKNLLNRAGAPLMRLVRGALERQAGYNSAVLDALVALSDRSQRQRQELAELRWMMEWWMLREQSHSNANPSETMANH